MSRKDAENVNPSGAGSEPGADAQRASGVGFPVVGLGASAGGLVAFESFFSGMPAQADLGIAFVVVQHLAPDHKSLLADLVQRVTRLKVIEVEDGMRVQPDFVYIIPPNRDLVLEGGSLYLLAPSEPRGQRLPIDGFFRSLARDLHERAIGIVLSGTGSDGSLGVRAIKGEGGMVMVQQPESSDFDGMPRSAIATGLVDFVLPPSEMLAQLVAYCDQALGLHPAAASLLGPGSDQALKEIFALLANRTGHDFSNYKPGTIHRRIERRMAVRQIRALDDYVAYVNQTPTEVDALFRDLLIGVTRFFRDPEAFQVLEGQVIPSLFADKPPGGVIRVWSAGCSTGEEAYSLAILLQERMEVLRRSYTVQVFATDIDGAAIATARAGVFPASITADVSAKRLARFFQLEADGLTYRIHKGIRDMLVFSEHDLLKDPPFSRLDLISCRNLLIYFGVELQRRLIPAFHHALNPGGVLFLGTSEGVGDASDLFTVVDGKAKLYRRSDDAGLGRRAAVSRFLPTMRAVDAAMPPGPGKSSFPTRLPLRELTERALLRELAPAGVLVNGAGDILYVHGRTGLFLEPSPGEASPFNILKMARDGLRPALATALHKASGTDELVRALNVTIKTNGHYARVNASVRFVRQGGPSTQESRLYIVMLEEVPSPPGAPEKVAPPPPAVHEHPAETDADLRIAALEQELRERDEHLQRIEEQLETSAEELKSSNEEMQSVNEELQSTNEELETSKEELQSVNEELTTVNTELQNKLADLSRINNDMNNLLAGTGIATVFIDRNLKILRFTPNATQIINLIHSDIGRPVGHLVLNLVDYDSLVTDAIAVLDSLVPKEIQVQSRKGHWFSMRIQPYRTQNNVIEGAVITFIDIDHLVQAQEALKKANDLARLAVVLRDAHDAITVQGLDGQILAWNPGAERMFGWSEAEALQMNVRDRIPPDLRKEAEARFQRLNRAERLAAETTRRLTKSGAVVEVSLIATALVDEAGNMYAIATTERLTGPLQNATE